MTEIGTEYWGVSRAAAHLGRSVDWVRDRFDAGELPGIRTGAGYRLIDPTRLNNYKESYTVSGAARALRRHPKTIRAWFDAGRLWGHRSPAGYRLIDADAVAAVRAQDPA